jgi:hypothetical protein
MSSQTTCRHFFEFRKLPAELVHARGEGQSAVGGSAGDHDVGAHVESANDRACTNKYELIIEDLSLD